MHQLWPRVVRLMASSATLRLSEQSANRRQIPSNPEGNRTEAETPASGATVAFRQRPQSDLSVSLVVPGGWSVSDNLGGHSQSIFGSTLIETG